MLGAVLVLFVALTLAATSGALWARLRAGGPARRRALLALALAAGFAGVGLVADPVSQKIVGHLIMPTGWIWLLLIALTAEAVRGGHRALAWGLAVTLVIFSLAGNGVLGTLGLISLQGQVPAVNWRTAPTFDAVLVLGGGTKPAPPPARYELSGSGDRVLLGARMYLGGHTRVLVTTGRGVPGLSEEDLTEATAGIWAELGIPEGDIIRVKEPYNTKQELAALAVLVEAHGWRRVGVISSGYHLPRAMAHAARQGLDVVPIAADHFMGPDRITVLSWIPQRSGFSRVHATLWELVGRAVGR